jgi:choline-glycine betaine transporter
VGLFIARISRSRTIRNVIVGAFLVPCAFVMVWFGVLGSLSIKMQRVAELVLIKDPDSFNTASPDCEMMRYADGVPVSQEAQALANAGYYPLSCRPFEGYM